MTPDSTSIEPEAEKIARAFHDEYEAFAEANGWETQEVSRVSFDELPAAQRQTMVDTVSALLDRRLISAALSKEDHPGGGAAQEHGVPDVARRKFFDVLAEHSLDEALEAAFAAAAPPLIELSGDPSKAQPQSLSRDQAEGLERIAQAIEKQGRNDGDLGLSADDAAAFLRDLAAGLCGGEAGPLEKLVDAVARAWPIICDGRPEEVAPVRAALNEARAALAQSVPSHLSEEAGCEKHGRPDCEDCYLDALAPSTDLGERLNEEAVLDEAEDAYKSSPVGGRRALEAAFDAALEAIKNAR